MRAGDSSECPERALRPGLLRDVGVRHGEVGVGDGLLRCPRGRCRGRALPRPLRPVLRRRRNACGARGECGFACSGPRALVHARACICACAHACMPGASSSQATKNPPEGESRPQIDPRSRTDRHQINLKATADRRQIGTKSTPDRPQIDLRASPSRRKSFPVGSGDAVGSGGLTELGRTSGARERPHSCLSTFRFQHDSWCRLHLRNSGHIGLSRPRRARGCHNEIRLGAQCRCTQFRPKAPSRKLCD